MGKFNFSQYIKTNGDEHIDKKLQEQHENAPNTISEDQLEDYRVQESNVTLEKLLEKTRTGEADALPEYRLNNSKSKLVKQRNSSAYTGDMSKLEQKRLENDPVEDEKYETATTTPKPFRWWERKSPDGLKLAKKDDYLRYFAFNKQAEEDTEDLEYMEDENHSDDVNLKEDIYRDAPIPVKQKMKPVEELIDMDDFEINVKGTGEGWSEWGEENKEINDNNDEDEDDEDDVIGLPSEREGSMTLIKEKYLDGQIPGVYMLFAYDSDEFPPERIQDAKNEALKKILEINPDLSGMISIDDISEVEEGSLGEQQLALRVVGEQYAPIVVSHQESPFEDSGEMIFTTKYYDEEDLGGTPTAWGSIKFNIDVTDKNKDAVLQDAVAYIEKEFPSVIISKDKLDTSALEEHVIGFMAPLDKDILGEEEEPTYEEIRDELNIQSSTDDFKIIYKNSSKKK